MKYLKNIMPYVPVALDEIVTHTGSKIASKALINSEHTEIRFFSFAKGESIDKEYYEMDTLFWVIEGSLKVLYKKDNETIVHTGEIVALEADIDYGVEALEDTKVCTILVKA
ncbi:cupin [Cellulosilyticum sp. I15G10I2]|uniref:cupin n=1 Tax=Cellulosilyticum sp. I15G10I2 TaxID=1892843 RepID=UPI00085C4CAC|nr:cupin [Cellulosilyticum sp. I15G10I2]